MYIFQRIFRAVCRRFRRAPQREFQLSGDTVRSLEKLAKQARRTPDEMADLLLTEAVRKQETHVTNWELWESLTPREQEVAALVCCNYTTRQIAARLHISPETVKTHVEHVLEKFNVPERNALRMLLSDWDFSAWNP